jgi:hypothetical protein
MKAMEPTGASPRRNPWPLIRLAALVVVIIVFGTAGVESGIRTAGGVLMVFAGVQLVRRFRGNPASCEVSGQLPVWPALLLAAAQAGVGVVMLGWPESVLQWLLSDH